MDKYMHRPPLRPQKQQRDLADFKRRKPSVEDDRRTSVTSKKMRLLKETEYLINNNVSSKYTSQGHGSSRTSQSTPTGFDSPASLAPSQSTAVNWRLACFLAREYLSRGTLLGKPWPAQDSNMRPAQNGTVQPNKDLQGDEAASEREAQYSSFTTNFLRSDDIHIPGICNPSQMVAWLGFK